MSTNQHTPISAGTAMTVASVNSPLGQLDSAVSGVLAGTKIFDMMAFVAPTSTTITSNTINSNKMHVSLVPETGSTDDLEYITIPGSGSKIIILRSAYDIRIKTTGNIYLRDAETQLEDFEDSLVLFYSTSINKWVEWNYRGTVKTKSPWGGLSSWSDNLVLPPVSYRTVVDGNAEDTHLLYTPSLEARNHWGVRCQGGTTHVELVTVTATGGTSIAAANNDVDTANRYTSSASNGATAGIVSANFTQWRLAHYAMYAGRFWLSSSTSNQRLYVGLTAATPPNSDTLANPFVGFRYSSVAGDAGLRPVTHDGGGQVVGAALVAATASTLYDFRILCKPGQVQLTIWIAGAAATTTLTTLPSSSTDLGFACLLVTNGSNANALDISRLYGESGGQYA